MGFDSTSFFGRISYMKLIIDTDLGNDCDDAGALAVMHNLKKEYPFELLAICCSTSYVEGAYTAELINRHYGACCPIGQNEVLGWPTFDAKELYTQKICSKDDRELSVNVNTYIKTMRKALATSDEKVTLVILGPMNAFNLFLLSSSDETSPLDGVSLINNNVEHIYVMGGKFCKEKVYYYDNEVTEEWNIKCDPQSVQNFLASIKVCITFVPYEIGLMETGINLFKNADNPVSKCYRIYANGERFSWDLITVYYAITKNNEYFEESPLGRISVSDIGETNHQADEDGIHTYLLAKRSKEEIKKLIDRYLY